MSKNGAVLDLPTAEELSVSPHAMREIYNQEIQRWKNTIAMHKVRHGTFLVLEDTEQMNACETEIGKCIKAIDHLRGKLDNLENAV